MSAWAESSAAFLATVLRDPTGGSWAEGLDAIADAQGSQWAQIHIDDGDYADSRLSVTGLNSDFNVQTRLLAGGFQLLDPRPGLMSTLVGQTKACWQLLDADAFDASPFVNEFLDRRENDLRWAMGAGSVLSTGSRVVFGVSRSRSGGRYELAEVSAFAALAPALLSAVALHDKLRVAERAVQDLAEARGAGGMIIALDRRGGVAYANARGMALLDGPVFAARMHGAARFADPQAQAALEMAISRGDDGLPLKIVAGGHSLTLSTVPAMMASLPGELASIRVLIEGRGPGVEHADAALSKREREVADLLARGMSLPDISARLGKSIETVRAQLKSAMRKLGVHSQAQMVSILLERR